MPEGRLLRSKGENHCRGVWPQQAPTGSRVTEPDVVIGQRKCEIAVGTNDQHAGRAQSEENYHVIGNSPSHLTHPDISNVDKPESGW